MPNLFIGEPFFTDGWRRIPYQFISEDAQAAFAEITNSCKKPWVDYDLFHRIKRMFPDLRLTQKELQPRCAYEPNMLRKHCEIWEKQSATVTRNYDSKALAKAYSSVLQKFKLRDKVKPIAFDEVPWINDTNFGAPYFKNSKKMESPQEKAIAGAKAIKRGRAFYPFSGYHRGKSDTEVRIIWAEGKSEWMVGAIFFYPYFEALKMQTECPYAGVHKRLGTSARVNTLKWRSRFILAMDYSKFDATIPPMLIKLAFKIIKHNLELSRKEEELFDRYVTHFCTNGIIMPDGFIYYGRQGGVPSGSVFTSLIDSIVNAILIEYCMQKGAMLATDYLVLGDDSIVGLARPVNKAEIVSLIGELGVKVSDDDTFVTCARTEASYFLGHYWEYGAPRRDVVETITRLCCPEFPQPWNFAEFGSHEYKVGLFDKIKDYQNDNDWFWKYGNTLIDSFLLPDEPWNWGEIVRPSYQYYNLRLEAKAYRPTGLARAFGEDWSDASTMRTVAM